MAINLLPRTIRTQRRNARGNAQALLGVVIALIVIAVLDVALVVLKTVIEGNVRNQNKEIEQVQAEINRYQKVAEAATDNKRRADVIATIFQERLPVTKIVSVLSAALPFSVTLESLDTTLSAAPNLSVSATAPSIREAEKFRANLESSPLFQNAVVSSYAVTAEGVVNFNLTADLEIQKSSTPTSEGKK